MPVTLDLCVPRQGIVASLFPNSMSLLRRTVAKELPNRVKFQGMVSADTKRFLEIEWREGKDPTLLTWNDLAEYCVESGLERLVQTNKSEHGLYVVEMVTRKRKMDAEHALRRIEQEVEDWVPREERKRGTVSPIRRVEEA